MPGTNSLARNGRRHADTLPPVHHFHKRVLKQTYEVGGQPRAAVAPAKDPQNLTDAEKIARYEQWRPFTANAGTYEIKGSTLTICPIVAKNVNLMTSSYVQEFKLEGPNTLWLIPTPDNATTEPRIKLTAGMTERPTGIPGTILVPFRLIRHVRRLLR